jgi:hypothetical protein
MDDDAVAALEPIEAKEQEVKDFATSSEAPFASCAPSNEP